MRGQDIQQEEWFSYKTLEERVPEDHPLRIVRLLTNGLQKSMDSDSKSFTAAQGDRRYRQNDC